MVVNSIQLGVIFWCPCRSPHKFSLENHASQKLKLEVSWCLYYSQLYTLLPFEVSVIEAAPHWLIDAQCLIEGSDSGHIRSHILSPPRGGLSHTSPDTTMSCDWKTKGGAVPSNITHCDIYKTWTMSNKVMSHVQFLSDANWPMIWF